MMTIVVEQINRHCVFFLCIAKRCCSRRKRRRCHVQPKEAGPPEDETSMEVHSSFLSEDDHTESFSPSPSKV